MSLSPRQWTLAVFWFILVLFILVTKIVPSGQASYELNYRHPNRFLGGRGFIGHLTPAERVSQENKKAAIMIGDPIYFSVFTPRTFSEVKITITYRDELSSSTPVIEAGVLMDNLVWRYLTKPLENKTLDSLNDWTLVSAGATTLYQREPIFSSVADFISLATTNPEEICFPGELNSCLALYNPPNLDFLQKRILGPQQDFIPWTSPLRGAHQFYFTAPANQELFFSFKLSNLNPGQDSDPIYLTVYEGRQIICQNKIENKTETKEQEKIVTLTCPPLANSETLKLEVKGSLNLVIKEINAAPGALSFVNRIYLLESESRPLEFWTDRNLISLTTVNPASRQKITFGENEFSLAEPYERYEFFNNSLGLKKVSLSKDDFILETGGVFSLEAQDFFNPDYDLLSRYFSINEEIAYIIADYEPPIIREDGLKEATLTFNTQDAYRKNGEYNFMLSVPGLEPKESGQLIIEKIKLEFTGRNLWQKLADYF